MSSMELISHSHCLFGLPLTEISPYTLLTLLPVQSNSQFDQPLSLLLRNVPFMFSLPRLLHSGPLPPAEESCSSDVDNEDPDRP